MTRCTALVGFLVVLASPICAETSSGSKPDAAGSAQLEQPAVFDINARSGALKETVQKGQALVWRGKEGEKERQFQVDNISIAFLRSETGSQVKTTFSGKISSLGYLTSDDATNVSGAVDKRDLRIAWTLGQSNDLVFQTLLAELAKPQGAANAFAYQGQSSVWEIRPIAP